MIIRLLVCALCVAIDTIQDIKCGENNGDFQIILLNHTTIPQGNALGLNRQWLLSSLKNYMVKKGIQLFALLLVCPTRMQQMHNIANRQL
jgi:hypothetical protein